MQKNAFVIVVVVDVDIVSGCEIKIWCFFCASKIICVFVFVFEIWPTHSCCCTCVYRNVIPFAITIVNIYYMGESVLQFHSNTWICTTMEKGSEKNEQDRMREWENVKYANIFSTDIFRQDINDFNGVVDTEWIFKISWNGSVIFRETKNWKHKISMFKVDKYKIRKTALVAVFFSPFSLSPLCWQQKQPTLCL